MEYKSPNRRGLMLIVALWLLVFISDPLYLYYASVASDMHFNLERILTQWSINAGFLVLYLVHHFVLVPRFVVKKRMWQYVVCTLLCLLAFTVFLVLYHSGHHPGMRPPLGDPPLIAPPDMARVVIAALMILADLGIVAWTNGQRLREKLLILEKQSLDQELSHLRYQINPHFLMNTLNNIHVLVDVDQDRAKRSIIELSNLMRYSLYECNDQFVPLQHEVRFLELYISLMSLRFNDKVRVGVRLPDSSPSYAMLPPMLLATFVENAFKHGISYQRPSYIDIQLQLEDEGRSIHFRCENSRHATATPDGHHGIGLSNVRKRLDLQYADDYTLQIDEGNSERFVVDLWLKAKPIVP